MNFNFFNASDAMIFARNDAESASWTVEEMSVQMVFPYDADKPIRRGMRVGFFDDDGVYQPFEIRKVKTLEPDHYQDIHAEHIAVAELTDEVYAGAEITDETAAAALADALEGTLWEVGDVAVENTSSADLSRSTVWAAVRSIEKSWNVYIIPRVTIDETGITGRYLDIVRAEGTWRGIRLSVDKNADQVGVTVDDTETATAMYGYGATEDDEPLTFADVVWQATDEHPAKPAGQEYIEDPEATAAYGRNGRPRFAYWSNGSITDKNVLLEKTWEYLKTTNAPKVTIDCSVTDLYRLGYADQPIRLHDTAIVDIAQTATHLQEEIINLTIDLLDPTQTRATIGAYIPNIIYIDRDTGRKARGGGGGGRGNDPNEDLFIEYRTDITQTNERIALQAQRVDRNESILNQAGMILNAQGVLIYSTDNLNMVGSRFNVLSDRISLVVTDESNPKIKPAAIVAAINQQTGQSTIRISANVIDIDGIVTGLQSKNIYCEGFQANGSSILVGDVNMVGRGQAGWFTVRNTLTVAGTEATWQETTVVTSVGAHSDTTRYLCYSNSGGTTVDGSVKFNYISSCSPSVKTLHYLGRTPT